MLEILSNLGAAFALTILYLISTLAVGLLLSIDRSDPDYVLSVTAWAWIAGMFEFVIFGILT